MKAILFDLNGTMVDDMDHHTLAWLHVVNQKLGECFSYEQMKKHMYGKNKEVLGRIFGQNYFSAFELEHLSNAKEEHYRKSFLPRLQLVPGLEKFLQTAASYGIPMGIASAASTANIDFVLDNLDIRQYFDCIISADQVAESKPHPETFLRAANGLNTKPADCLVFEDTPKGVEAAANAGMSCIVLTTSHQAPDFREHSNIKAFWKNYYLNDEDIFKY